MKKLLTIVLSVCIVLSLCIPAFASRNDAQANALNSLGLFKGTDKGFELDNAMTREQGIVMIIRLLGKENEAIAKNPKNPFEDLRNYNWADPYVGYAYENGISKGISETKFGYGNTMTDAMFLTMLLRVLGYKDADDGSADFTWRDPYALAKTVKLSDGEKRDPFLRDDMVLVCWNALEATRKNSETKLSADLMKDGVFTEAAYESAAISIVAAEIAGGSNGGSSGGSSGGGSSSGGSGGGGNAPAPIDDDPTDPTPPSTDPSLTLDKASLRLEPGTTATITATTANIDGQVEWTTSNPAAATVSGGVVTAVAEGTAQITAKIGDLVKHCSVTVAVNKPLDDNSTPWIPAP